MPKQTPMGPCMVPFKSIVSSSLISLALIKMLILKPTIERQIKIAAT